MVPAMEAMGLTELTFKTANLAEAVDVPPMRRSVTEIFGYNVPLTVSKVHLDKPEVVLQLPQEAGDPPNRH
jgi:hypothetical protein